MYTVFEKKIGPKNQMFSLNFFCPDFGPILDPKIDLILDQKNLSNNTEIRPLKGVPNNSLSLSNR